MDEKKHVRLESFQVVASDAFALKMNDNMAQVIFGIEQPGEVPQTVFDQFGVAMTPKSLKLFSYALAKLVEAFEKQNGAIPVSAEKLEAVQPKIHHAPLKQP
jgi:hypothetical protein